MKSSYKRLMGSNYIEREDILDFLNKKGFEEIFSVWFSKKYNFIFFEIDIRERNTLFLKLIEKINLNKKELNNRFGWIQNVDEDYFLSFKENETNEIINIMKNEKEEKELKEIMSGNNIESKKKGRL